MSYYATRRAVVTGGVGVGGRTFFNSVDRKSRTEETKSKKNCIIIETERQIDLDR